MMQKIISKLIFACILTGVVNVGVAVAQNDNRTETQIIYLSGTGYKDTKEWEFFITGGRKSGEWSTISVPSVWEQEGFGKYQYGIKFYGKPHPDGIADEKGKYKYAFEVPKAWENRRVRIVFDGSMTDTEVRINGRSAGPTHQGGFYRFKYDITGLLKYGKENLLEVTVSKESSNGSVNLAERRADYWNFGGIFRPVFLESVPATFIERTAIDAQADGSFLAEVFLGNASEADLTLRAQITDSKGKSVGKTIEKSFRKGGDKVVLEANFTNIDNWTAETPNLYHIKFSLFNGKELLHTVDDRFGFRTIEIRKSDGIYVNRQRVLMKGVNKHSFWPESGRTLNKQLNYADAKLIKEMNMNSVRLSHYPSDPEFLDACDELGLYVLHELGGWHGHYDETVGMKLVKSLVTRDVNHPSVIFWDNGNEGGWNTELDDEFAKWDPQNRPVLHPQQLLNGVETMHYRSYGETQEYSRGDYIYMPTEFLHGLYDGGHGAGLYDYWEFMRKHPRSGGGYLWVFADEGIARTDQNGRIDNQGNFGADGIVGPHHEKEGSFYTIKEVWSPVMIMEPDTLSADFDGTMEVENRYDFTNLNACTFEWTLAKFPKPGANTSGHEVVAKKSFEGPDIAPHEKGELKIDLPDNWKESDALYLKVTDPFGKELWTWSYSWEKPTSYLTGSGTEAVTLTEKKDLYVVNSGDLQIQIDKTTGKLIKVSEDEKPISFKGLRFVAARRGDRTLDGNVDVNADKGLDRIYKEIAYTEELKTITANKVGENIVIEANYFGPLQWVVWTVHPGGLVEVDCQYQYNGVVELMGISFDYPEKDMQSIQWLGNGPYRVWQNRLHGTKLNVWQNDYNDPVPGESFIYPEFKGYFDNWHWANFKTSEGDIYMANEDQQSYLGVYTPRDGRDALLYTLPETGISVLDVIPAVRNKVNATDLIGPSSQAQWVNGPKSHKIYLRFKSK